MNPPESALGPFVCEGFQFEPEMKIRLTRTPGSERGDRGNSVPYRDQLQSEKQHSFLDCTAPFSVFWPVHQA